MRIVFDVTSCAKERRGGIGTYGAELVRACARVAPQHEYVLAVRTNRWYVRQLVDDLLPGTRARLLLDRIHAPLGKPVDLLHGIGVRLPAGGSFPKVVMLHDLNVFELPELSSEVWNTKRAARIRQTIDRADRLLSYSEHGRRALQQHLGVPPERVSVVPLGVDTGRFRPHGSQELRPVLERHDLLGRPFVLLVGTYGERKNHAGLLDAFVHAALPDDWVLVLGGPRGDDAVELAARAASLGLPERRLRLPGWIADDDLPILLAGASIYCCASLHEGFGLPVIEAQACGTPVASSDRAALLETLGDCGVAFDPEDREAFAAALRQLAGDAELRADLAARGPQRVATHYSWEDVAERTLAVFAEVVERCSGG